MTTAFASPGPTPSFEDDYRHALAAHVLDEAGEQALMHAYELGRRAVGEHRNILDLVALHQDTMLTTALERSADPVLDDRLERGRAFLAEVMAPFEMMQRGFLDTIHQLQEVNATLEQRVDERTRALAESEHRNANLARLYSILSGINSAIVRLRNRGDLFDEVCRIAVNQGGYAIAWVTLRGAAWEGAAGAWCQSSGDAITRRTDPPEAIRLAIETAIDEVFATGKPLVRSQPCAAPREPAFCAYAVLPLRLADRVVGVLALFSSDLAAFDATELRLLQELAGDISFALDHIQKEEQITYLAYHDELTGLPNLNLLLERLGQQTREAQRGGKLVALLLIDLVRFSSINDTYGRHIGDLLIKQVGARLSDTVKGDETAARLGADHFALTLSTMGNPGMVAHRLEREVLRTFGDPFTVDGSPLHLSVQVGISIHPLDAEDADTLLRNAEIALKRAKSEARPYLLFDPAMNERVVNSLTMEAKLRKAFEHDELVVLYQPKVAAENGRMKGMEALVRYVDPANGTLSPTQFIPLMEETGMIVELGEWVLRRCVRDVHDWRRAGLDPPRVAVNVSPIQLRQPDFVARLHALVADHAGADMGLDIEITESAMMEQIEENIPKLDAIRELGFHIAIDDFGTGYSSLSYLSRLPVNALKIDRSFIVGMTESPTSLALVTSIISLAHALELEVIAEGVEFAEQAKLLRLLRCELIQGNLYSAAVSSERIANLFGQPFPAV